MADLALVNVDYVSPSLWMGVFLCIAGLTLYTFKMSNARGVKDGEIVTAALLSTAGGILAVQGWRLDPILMLSSGVLSSVGVYYIVQTVELRKEIQVRVCVALDQSIAIRCKAAAVCGHLDPLLRCTAQSCRGSSRPSPRSARYSTTRLNCFG
jgi:Ycf66 protein N-terminus